MLACLLAVGCQLPPRVDDRGTPEQAFRTFRGALARGEHDREWECLSDPLRGSLGIHSSAEWKDAREIVLDQRHLLVRGIGRSEVEGEARALPDGRTLLRIGFPFGYEAQVWMRPVPVLRAFVEGDPVPKVYEHLDELSLALDPERRELLIRVPGAIVPYIAEEIRPGRRFARVEAAIEWFIDDFEAGDETPASVRRDLEEKGQEP
jgi:hypothetical protein